MDDLTVMDGVCHKIIKQSKLSKRKPHCQIDNSFVPVLAYHIRLKSYRMLAAPITYINFIKVSSNV